MTVRRFAPTDLDDFLAYQSHPVVRRYVRGEPIDADAVPEYLAAQAELDERQRDAWHAFAVELHSDKRVIGDVGVWLSSEKERRDTGDVGYQFHPDFHGRGYAYEAMTLFLPYLFETLGLRSLTAACDLVNERSWHLMERLGMRRLSQTGDSVQYGLARADWSAGRSAYR